MNPLRDTFLIVSISRALNIAMAASPWSLGLFCLAYGAAGRDPLLCAVGAAVIGVGIAGKTGDRS
jgi:hypothetical protein